MHSDSHWEDRSKSWLTYRTRWNATAELRAHGLRPFHRMKPAADRVSGRLVFTHPVHFIAFGFGAGLSPLAPGTVGTAAAIPLYLALSQLPLTCYWITTGLLALVGVWVCGYSARLLGVHDHPGIVWDEMVGLLVAMGMTRPSWFGIVAGFLIFRLFDISKPWPINIVDRKLPGGLGVMADDLIAGLYSLLILGLVAKWL